MKPKKRIKQAAALCMAFLFAGMVCMDQFPNVHAFEENGEFPEEAEMLELSEMNDEAVVPETEVPESNAVLEPEALEIPQEKTESVQAEASSGSCGENAAWSIDEGSGILTISGSGDMADYAPSTPWGPVRTPWKSYADSMKAIVIENGITSIGEQAFSGCKNVTEVVIPDSVAKIGNGAFEQCDSLTEMKIPDTVTKIGRSLFWGCENLQRVSMGSGVTEIGSSAFDGCISLVDAPIPNSVAIIEYRAFQDCRSLPNVVIPSSVAKIENKVFFGCDSLVEVAVPESVTKIEGYAFGSCDKLSKIQIPGNVTSIGAGAFAECVSLTDIIIPENVVSIGGYAFENCSKLENLTIPESVSEIGWAAFERCSSLREIKLPESLTLVDTRLFSDCENLQKVSMGNNVKMIHVGAFENCGKLTDINLSSTVATIEYEAFYNCSSLPEVVISSTVSKLGGRAFGNCSSLKDVYFLGDAPEFSSEIRYQNVQLPFADVTADVHYPIENTTWTSANKLDYDGKLTWIEYNPADNMKIVPEITDKIYVIGSDKGAVIKCTAPLEGFVSLEIDGMIVEPSNYTAEKGSTVITIMSSYLDKLTVGDHVVTLNYTFGSVDTVLTVVDRGTGDQDMDNSYVSNKTDKTDNEAGNQKSPKTGDNFAWESWSFITLVAGCGCVILLRRTREVFHGKAET